VLYAIGDVHGRADLLEPLLETIFKDVEDQPCLLVMLGDYVDSGEASRSVIERLANGPFPRSMETVFLKGNHEAALLDFIQTPETGPAWVEHGGRETLLSYGVRAPLHASDAKGWREASQAFSEALPESHTRWLEALRLFHISGEHFFVHAGVDKGRDPHDQDEATLLWTRGGFLRDHRRWPLTVVHGHTPEPKPVVVRGRIGLDTGAYATGCLTAARLKPGRVVFFSARAQRLKQN
jgi:serine/threonine protein phosphatase 1